MLTSYTSNENAEVRAQLYSKLFVSFNLLNNSALLQLLSLILKVLAIFLTKLIAEISEHGYIATKKSDRAINMSSQTIIQA